MLDQFLTHDINNFNFLFCYTRITPQFSNRTKRVLPSLASDCLHNCMVDYTDATNRDTFPRFRVAQPIVKFF